MRMLFQLTFHIIYVWMRLLHPNGAIAIAVENAALRNQLMIAKRKLQKTPKLTAWDRLVFSICATLIKPSRLLKSAIIIKPATLLRFHKALVNRKYHLLYSSKYKRKPGPKGPSDEIIQLIIEMKMRNPRFGARRIAMQITNIFGIEIDKDSVLRVLSKNNTIPPGGGPSWLSLIGNMKDSLWSLDFFRCESMTLKSHWVMIVMEQYTRRIIGIAAHSGPLDGLSICKMFNAIIPNQRLPIYLSSDHDPLFLYHRWIANLEILGIKQIKSIPYTPISHPFIERLIGTIRREYLDQILFVNNHDLERKLQHFMHYYNQHRAHHALNSQTPLQKANLRKKKTISIKSYRWKSQLKGLVQLPIAA